MMPQHVGVDAVVYFLGDDADGLTRTCMRGHFYEGCGATLAFTFVANPHWRVLSAAALQKVIRLPGGVVGPSTAPKAGEVAKFRGWVAKLRWNRFYVAPQVDLTRAFNGTAAQYVGRATDVVGGMRHVLEALGYDNLEERLTAMAHATTDMKNAGGFVAPAGEGVPLHRVVRRRDGEQGAAAVPRRLPRVQLLEGLAADVGVGRVVGSYCVCAAHLRNLVIWRGRVRRSESVRREAACGGAPFARLREHAVADAEKVDPDRVSDEKRDSTVCAGMWADAGIENATSTRRQSLTGTR